MRQEDFEAELARVRAEGRAEIWKVIKRTPLLMALVFVAGVFVVSLTVVIQAVFGQ